MATSLQMCGTPSPDSSLGFGMPLLNSLVDGLNKKSPKSTRDKKSECFF